MRKRTPTEKSERRQHKKKKRSYPMSGRSVFIIARATTREHKYIPPF